MGQGQQGTEVETGHFSSFNLSHVDSTFEINEKQQGT